MFKKSELGARAFIIAEVGQNHQGEESLALDYIEKFAVAGADAIKFQVRENRHLFNIDAYLKSYESENAFADTYGAHREKLELSVGTLANLKNACHERGVKFMATPFDEPSIATLEELDVDIIKIASFDVGNLPFIKRVIDIKKPIIISTGGAEEEVISSTIEFLSQRADDFAILHCVSEYPCPHNRLGLSEISELIDRYPEVTIGLSDHFNGTLSGPVGYMLGARVFEKHVSMNRAWKGTDHSFALEPHGFTNFARDIHRVPEMLIKKPRDELGLEPVFQKLGKSAVALRDFQIGERITMEDLSGKIFTQQYIPVKYAFRLVDRKVLRPIKAGAPLTWEDVG